MRVKHLLAPLALLTVCLLAESASRSTVAAPGHLFAVCRACRMSFVKVSSDSAGRF
jgi:hypothetical protein